MDSYKKEALAFKTICYFTVACVTLLRVGGSVLPKTDRGNSRARVGLIFEAQRPHWSGGAAWTCLYEAARGPGGGRAPARLTFSLTAW